MRVKTPKPEGVAREQMPDETTLTRADVISAFIGVAVLIVAAVIFFAVPPNWPHFMAISDDGLYRQAILRLDVILGSAVYAAYELTPAVHVGVFRVRRHWREHYTYIGLAAICAFLWSFIIHFGRHQFGAFDFNILIEIGWRQILGQRPFVDFPGTTPPGFNLGCKYAFQVFGVNWDANLYWAASFASSTFLWMYWLMRRISMGRLASAAFALGIECAAMLTLCFWWYNNSALIAAAVFFLSCIAFIRQPTTVGVEISYCASLVLVSLMKPNIAGLTIACCVLIVFLVTEKKFRMVALTLAAVVAALAVLAWNHVPVGSMLTSYLSVAKGRGGVHERFGYRQMNHIERESALFWLGILSVPLLGLIPVAVSQIEGRRWRELGLACLLPVSALVAFYGLLTNGEFRDAECTLLLAAVGVLSFGLRWNTPELQRLTIALLCASIAVDLYYGAERLRVYGVGPHVFFEWHDDEHRINKGFLKNMRVSGSMVQVQDEVADALKSNAGPYFFGPRLDFNYAVFGIASPEQFPAWWHPGTAFPTSAQSEIIDCWKRDRFETLIFMKTGFAGYDEAMFYSYYPPEFMSAIRQNYAPDERYPELTVYHLRQTGH